MGFSRAVLLVACVAWVPVAAVAQTRIDTSAGPMLIAEMAGRLDEPWALDFMPDGRFLVTERDGRLLLFEGPGVTGVAVAGVPDVVAQGQGGLLDVMIPRDFATSRAVYLTYSARTNAGAGTAAGWGRLSENGKTLEGFTTIFTAEGAEGGNHFGSRLVEARDGTLFLTLGERGQGAFAQDPARAEGKVVHITRNGKPATTLPDTLPGVHSLGHRNPQGAAIDGQGRLWVIEHGAQGGDELNRVRKGANYGWPVIAYGEQYGGGQLGEGSAKDGLEQPVMYWDPSIAPSGMVIHSGNGIPDWRGDVFTGSLKFDYISRLDPDNGYAEERISSPETGRVRDVIEAPDGSIWFLSVYNGAVYRMAPDGQN